ncbi:hypothetical protein [Stratiformator vulcanicus]|uniref:Uncharacterized protein n=1 Tax=Stratiformator vulcanicus TaxID=2527980 RepID=A0A517R0M9_9PLAN|nr:hypothetical protein [Stratiformator vulcanicus]QDT37455.1 hypothetical protein Pan189_18350 [Stratiformator vulcanicus]
MELPDQLAVIARRISDYPDARHAVINVADDFAAVATSPGIPDGHRPEFDDLARELSDIKPRFPSQPTTSILFDRAGLGKPGRERALRIAHRIEALSRDLAADRAGRTT